jgi:hypothetical protein
MATLRISLAFSMAAVGGLLGATLTPRLIKLIGEGQLIVSSSILLAFAGLSQLLLFVVPAQFAAAVMIPAEFFTSFTVSAAREQKGHWKSDHRTITAGAFAFPRIEAFAFETANGPAGGGG